MFFSLKMVLSAIYYCLLDKEKQSQKHNINASNSA